MRFENTAVMRLRMPSSRIPTPSISSPTSSFRQILDVPTDRARDASLKSRSISTTASLVKDNPRPESDSSSQKDRQRREHNEGDESGGSRRKA